MSQYISFVFPFDFHLISIQSHHISIQSHSMSIISHSISILFPSYPILFPSYFHSIPFYFHPIPSYLSIICPSYPVVSPILKPPRNWTTLGGRPVPAAGGHHPHRGQGQPGSARRGRTHRGVPNAETAEGTLEEEIFFRRYVHEICI